MIPVVWLTYTEGEHPEDKWDSGLLRLMFAHETWTPARASTFVHSRHLPATGGAVVVFPGGIHKDQHDRLNADLAPLDWVLLIVTADEGSLFEAKHVHHPNLILWVMTPRPGVTYPPGTRFIGHGYHHEVPHTLRLLGAHEPTTDVFFAGQLSHLRRRQMATALAGVGDIIETDGFAQGLNRSTYLDRMASTKVAPCPSGPVTPDSFRLYEALEAGCLPIADATCPDYDTAGYWDLVAPGHPFPELDTWNEADNAVNNAVNDWPGNANHTFAWWQQHKRTMAYWLVDDLAELGAPTGSTGTLRDQVTVLMPTSPIPSNPSTAIIEETVASVRELLPESEIIITIDGVRSEQEAIRPDYDEFTRRLLWLCNHRWTNVVPVVHGPHAHQSGMAAAALDMVRTPFVFYVEHDLPIKGDIPLASMIAALEDGTADAIRLTVNTDLEPTHLHLMLDNGARQDVHGVPMVRTVQWSQQPHLATTSYYRAILGQWFKPGEATYIEWRMHSVCAGLWDKEGPLAWFRNRLWIYTPDGDMSRCYHLDGHGDVFDADGTVLRAS